MNDQKNALLVRAFYKHRKLDDFKVRHLFICFTFSGMWIKKISADFVQTVLKEAQDPTNKDMFQVHVLDPIIQYALSRLFPYILVTSIVFILTFMLAVAILVLIMNK